MPTKGEYLRENYKFRVWGSQKLHFLYFAFNRTSWVQYMSNSITYLIFEDKFFCHMYTLCNVHWLATSSKSKLQIKHYSIFSQQEMAAHGRGCPEGEEAPHGAEIAVCSHPQVIKLNLTLPCTRPGSAATCVTAWATWKAGTSKPTWPSWTVSWWGRVTFQLLKQKPCSISTATSSSGWHMGAQASNYCFSFK